MASPQAGCGSASIRASSSRVERAYYQRCGMGHIYQAITVTLSISVTLMALPSQPQNTSAALPGPPTCLILDHDNDGLDLTTPADGVDFDLDGDGTAERVGWTRSGRQDGFLAIDVNTNGTIDNGTELAGTGLRHPGLVKPMSGLGALLFLHGTVMGADGRPQLEGRPQLDANDSVFREFRVWFDSNHNGRSERDELVPLEQASISEFAVAYRRAPETGTYSPGVVLGSPNGNTVKLYGRYTVTVKGVHLARTAFEVLLQLR